MLRADDRGTGKSTGTFATATTEDFATDAEAGLAYLADAQGDRPAASWASSATAKAGVVAPMVAARNRAVSLHRPDGGLGRARRQVLLEQGVSSAAYRLLTMQPHDRPR